MKTTWKVIAIPALMVLCTTTVRADFVGLNIGASYWTPDLTGSFIGDSVGDTPINLADDLKLDSPSPSNLVLTLEHPIPLLPNIRYQSLELDSTGFNPNANYTYEGQVYTGAVNSTFDLSHNDLVLYYELLDNWVNLDVGLDVKQFDGEVTLSGTNSTIVPVDETVPSLYLSARFDLPFSGFYVGADINSIASGGNSLDDSTIMLGYESGSGLGFEGGIKKFSVELNEVTNVNTNLEYDGIYFNGYLHF